MTHSTRESKSTRSSQVQGVGGTDTTPEEGVISLYHEGHGYQEVWKSGSFGTTLPSTTGILPNLIQ